MIPYTYDLFIFLCKTLLCTGARWVELYKLLLVLLTIYNWVGETRFSKGGRGPRPGSSLCLFIGRDWSLLILVWYSFYLIAVLFGFSRSKLRRRVICWTRSISWNFNRKDNQNQKTATICHPIGTLANIYQNNVLSSKKKKKTRTMSSSMFFWPTRIMTLCRI